MPERRHRDAVATGDDAGFMVVGQASLCLPIPCLPIPCLPIPCLPTGRDGIGMLPLRGMMRDYSRAGIPMPAHPYACPSHACPSPCLSVLCLLCPNSCPNLRQSHQIPKPSEAPPLPGLRPCRGFVPVKDLSLSAILPRTPSETPLKFYPIRLHSRINSCPFAFIRG